MAEDQLFGLPPDARQMVMTGTTAMMNSGGAPAMMAPMMDMSGMMGPMAMGMTGDMGMGGPMMQVDGRGMMGVDGRGMIQVPDGTQGQSGPVGVGPAGNGTPEQGVGPGMIQDGYGGGTGGGMMGMGMDYGMQVSVHQISFSVSEILTPKFRSKIQWVSKCIRGWTMQT